MKIVFITVLFFILILLLLVFFSKKRFSRKTKKPSAFFTMERADGNPILSPDGREWSSQGTFNPAVIKDSAGRVHMLYRAMGSDGISRLGYTSSDTGFHFNDSLPYPVFTLETEDLSVETKKHEFNPLKPSGGGWSGSEDPRMVSIEGRIYVTFNAFEGWDFIRVSSISIDENDFYSKKFRWSKPLLLSPKGEVNKNWVLFPEKINGKFAILHSISPEVQIDYVNKLEDLSTGKIVIKSLFGQKKDRKSWDTWVRGAGPSPIKTDRGWLVLYHAVNKDYQNQYHLGALLLDLQDPRKVIARSPSALLTPEMWYENDWKPGVVYVCGAIQKDGELIIYYGGGDKHICAAKAPLDELVEWLVTHGKIS